MLRYDFELVSIVETTLEAPHGSEPVAIHAQPQRSAWSGRIEQSAERRFRDGSQGDRVRFLDVSLERGDAAPVPSSLSGLFAELRSFDDRQILAIGNLDELIGPDRHADLMLALWPALSPNTPELEPGQRARHRSNLPFMLASGMGMPISLDLEWELTGAVPCGDAECWQLRCEGPVGGRGLDRNDAWHARYRLSGQASGELLLGQLDNAVVDSQLTLELEIETILSDPDTQVPHASIRQNHVQRAVVRSAQDSS